jgi:hypothetical protein
LRKDLSRAERGSDICGKVWKLARAEGIQAVGEDGGHDKDNGGSGVFAGLWKLVFRAFFNFDSNLDGHVDFWGSHSEA